MNLQDISNIYQKNLITFFNDEKVIELIYKEQFGSKNYDENREYYLKKYKDIINNTVFIPYITLEHLDNFLINKQKNYAKNFLESHSNEKKNFFKKLYSSNKDIIKKNSLFMLDDLKKLFPNLNKNQYSKMLKNYLNIDKTSLKQLIPNLTEDNYLNISKHCSKKNNNFIDLYDLKLLLPNLTEDQYSKILNYSSNMATQYLTNELFKDTKGFFTKSKKLKTEKILKEMFENYRKKTNEEISTETSNINLEAQLLYGSKYIESAFSKELNLSKRLNAEKKDIIKKYSSFMLDDLKELFPSLTKDEYSKILKHCSNKSFDQNAKFIKEGFFTRFKKSKVEKIIEKYIKLTDEKVLMETSSYFKHVSDTPNGKYFTSIIDEISENKQVAIPKIGKDSDRNIRYIFLPILQYDSMEDYLKSAVHEVMHISKEIIHKNKYISGLYENIISQNRNESKFIENDSDFQNFIQSIKWSKKLKKCEINIPYKQKSYHIRYR